MGKGGGPHGKVRPVVRRPAASIFAGWDRRVWDLGAWLGVEMNLFGDWYAVSLTSPPDRALGDLRSCVGNGAEAWCISERMFGLSGVGSPI